MDDQIKKYITVGMPDKNWYKEHQELFVKLFGAGNLHFVAKLFAATSINSSLASNVRLFRKAKHEIENGLPFSNYLPVMKLQLERIRAGEPIRGRKITSFAAAMSGNVNAVVVDIWLLRAFGMNNRYMRTKKVKHPLGHDVYIDGRIREGGATDKQYTFIENYVRDLAPTLNLQPRELSAIIWSGVRIAHTGNRQTKYKEVLLQQHYNMFEV